MTMFDPIELVELGYQHQSGHVDWARAMIGPLSAPLNLDRLEIYGFFLKNGQPSGHFGIDECGELLDGAVVAEKHAHVLSPLSAEQERDMWLPFSAPGVLATSDPEMEQFFPRDVQRAVYQGSSAVMTGGRIAGALAVSLPIGAGSTLALIVNCLKPPSADRSRRALWRMLCAHLSAGLRLSARPSDPEAGDVECVLSDGGRVLDARGAATEAGARERLTEAVQRIDRARTKSGRADPLAALSAWLGLFDGRWSLVDHIDTDGRRLVLARNNEPDFWPTQSSGPLSKRQSQTLYCAAAGLSNKEVGYLLGMSTPTVATHLRRGLHSLGISSRDDWLRMSGKVEALLHDGAANTSRLKELTGAEREVAEMILDGASTERIAAARGTSASTVSNQISSILSKLGLRNRQALVHYLAQH